jgi:hypothetical protein
MSTHDLNIQDQAAQAARLDIQSAIRAVAQCLSSSSAPTNNLDDGMLWYDTSNDQLKIREGSSWISIGEVDGSAFKANVGYASTTQAQNGTDTPLTMNPARVKEAILNIALTTENAYTSSELTLSNAGSYTLTHSLGSIPSLVKTYFVCKVAEYGYSVGDVVDLSNITSMWTTGTVYYIGPTIVMNTTQIKVKFGANYPFLLNNFSTGGAGGVGNVPTNSSWRLLIKAWK